MSSKIYVTRELNCGGEPLHGTETLEVSNEAVLSTALIEDGASDVELELHTTPHLKVACLTCDREVTVKFNDAGDPDCEVVLKPGVPLLWTAGCGLACPLPSGVSRLFVTNASGGPAKLRGRFGFDQTAAPAPPAQKSNSSASAPVNPSDRRRKKEKAAGAAEDDEAEDDEFKAA